MDVSPEYVKMCEKAKEIQALKLEPNGSYQDGEYSQSILRSGQFYESTGTWLPHQDQLQEMIKRDSETNKALITRLLNAGYLTPIGWSMEQLWLAIVMKEKFSKGWDGDNWKEI